MAEQGHTPETLLAAIKSEAFAYGRCCDLYQDSLGTFHCHDCGQATFAMLRGVQALLGDAPTMSHEEATQAALIRRAAPDLLAATKALLHHFCGGGERTHTDGEVMDMAHAAIASATPTDASPAEET